MTFTLRQTSLTASGTTASGITYLATILPSLSLNGSLLIATMQTAHGGAPFKLQSQATGPGNIAAAAVGTGGTFAAGTYFYKLTCTTAAGETTAGTEVSATVVLNGSVALTWAALPAFVTGVKVYRGTSSTNEDHLITTLARTAVSYTDTGAVGSVATPPAANTAGLPNTGPGWEFCGLAAGGTIVQAEIWCYRNAPAGLSGATFTNGAGLACRGTIQEWTTTQPWQVMELFPGGAGSATTGNPSAAMTNAVGSGELAVTLLVTHFTVSPTSQTWTAPSGWTLILSQANSLATPWAAYYKTTTAAGAVSVTGNYSTTTNQDAKAAVVVVFREAAAVASRVGSTVSSGTYNDQATINPAQAYPASHAGSMQEEDFFVGRTFAQSVGPVYQTEGSWPTSWTPPSNMTDLMAAGAQVCWILKPARALTGGALATEQASMDASLTAAKQTLGLTGFITTLYNEYNMGGANGYFGNDTYKPSGDPYGTGNTDATAKANWLAYWANFAPLCLAHGIPVYTKPSYASANSCSSWHPPAGTVSGALPDFYYGDSHGKTVYLDQSPATGVPSLQDVCDGVRNPDNTAASNPPIPLGIGEWGRAGGSASTAAWSSVVSWSHTSTTTGHFRDVFQKRLNAGKQNAPIMWFQNNLGGPNWLHIPPEPSGGDITPMLTELRACVDNLTVSLVTAGNPVITTTSPLPPGQQGVPYSASLAATSGTTPYTWAVTTGALPAGLSLNASTGQITGTPSVTGTFASLGFTVTDAAALTGTATLSLTITSAATLAIPAQTLPQGTAGQPYSTAVTATGGTTPYTAWAVTAGALPTGLTLTPAGPAGAITGTPAGAGTSAFTIRVTDTASATASRALSIVVVTTALAVTTAQLPAATLNTAYSAQLGAANGTPPYTWAVTAGTLPPGLALTSDGVISGIPVASGVSSFTVQATDAVAATATQALSITVTIIIPPVPTGAWRLLLAAPQPDGTYLAEIAQAAQRTVILRTEPDQGHEAAFTVLGDIEPAAQIDEMLTDLHVLYGSQIVFCGRVAPSQDVLDAAGHHATFTAYDYREVLRRRAILPGDTLSFTGVEQATICWNLIQATQGRSGGNLGIARGTGQSTGVTRTMTFALGDYIGDDITTIAQLNNGFEWQLNAYQAADLRLDVFHPQQGASNGAVLAYGDGRVSSITRAVDPSTFANAVYETSTGLSAQFLESGTIGEGRWDKVIGASLKTASALADSAIADLAAAQLLTPSYTVACYPGTWGGPSDLWLGDTVTVQIRSGRLDVNDDLRIVEMQFDISPDGVETLTLAIGALPFRLHKKIAAVLKRLRYLESR